MNGLLLWSFLINEMELSFSCLYLPLMCIYWTVSAASTYFTHIQLKFIICLSTILKILRCLLLIWLLVCHCFLIYRRSLLCDIIIRGYRNILIIAWLQSFRPKSKHYRLLWVSQESKVRMREIMESRRKSLVLCVFSLFLINRFLQYFPMLSQGFP